MRKLKVFLTIGVILMAWLTGWGFRKEVPLPTPDSNLTDVPVRISLAADADFHEARADGFDIRITTDDGETLCKYEREYWTGGNGSAATAEIHIKAPSVLSAGGNKLYIYYGKSDATDGADAANTWDANFIAVYHLNEASGTTFADSSGNGNTLDANGDLPTQVDGKIYKGQDFDGVSDTADPNSALVTAAPLTLEAWCNLDSLPSNHGDEMEIIRIMDGTTNNFFLFRADDTNDYIQFAARLNGGSLGSAYSSVAVTASVWQYYVGVEISTASRECYINAGSKGTDTTDITPSGLTACWIGGASASSDELDGQMDEVRISNIARAEAWIKFTYDNYGTPPTLGSEEEESGDTELVVADGTHGHSTDAIALFQAHTLAVAEALHSHLADSPVLTQAHVLAIAAALHAQSADNIILTQAHILAIAESLHGLSSDSITLSQAHQLIVNACGHGHLADNITLFTGALLVVSDALHAHAADGITLTQVHNLLVNAGLHSLASDPIILSQAHSLIVNDGGHNHLADNIDLIYRAVICEYVSRLMRTAEYTSSITTQVDRLSALKRQADFKSKITKQKDYKSKLYEEN